MTSSTIVRPADPTLRAALRLAILFASIKLLLQFALTLWTTHLGYSYFRDEFYYLACGHHLAWGYVDQGPIVALQGRLGEILFGDSVFGIHVFSALAGAATLFLTGLLTWSLGGRRPAQALAMIGVLVVPIYIAVDGFLSMNSFEPVFWMLCALALIRIAAGASEPRWWMFFGLSAGIGLLNKPSMAVFLVAVCLGLLLTPQRASCSRAGPYSALRFLSLSPFPISSGRSTTTGPRSSSSTTAASATKTSFLAHFISFLLSSPRCTRSTRCSGSLASSR